MAALTVNQLPLAPLGAGDLIDRAIRLYRRHFFTLIRIAAPPVVISALGSAIWTIGWRELTTTSSEASLALFLILLSLGGALLFGGYVFNLVVIGGATRNLVTHLLWNEPVSARATYAAVRSRFWGLLGATLLITLWGGLSFVIALSGCYMVIALVSLGAVVFAQVAPVWLSALIFAVGFLTAMTLALWLFFFLVARVAYVPQIMLVEGKRVFAALRRSFSLARGNVRRLMAMALFTSFATYSALMILVIPLGLYGYLIGIDISPLNSMNWPAWYAIGFSVLTRSSYILLAPVWMLGLSLLYVDERVRHEGYDIELMAARQLSEMPPIQVSSPFAPAISVDQPKPPPSRPAPTGTVLGLR
jgi:hypothetical protein